jgi:acyl-coenzyme A thioesterase PaaI-like protein
MSAGEPTSNIEPEEEPMPLPWLDEPKFRCFGCSPYNPHGLALKMRRLDDGTLVSNLRISEQYASYPGMVHGGIIGVIVDELMCDLIGLDRQMIAISVNLRTRLLQPLLVGHRYRATARIARENEGLIQVEADIADLGGDLHVMASGSYRAMRSSQARSVMDLDDAEFDRLRHYFDHQIG